MAAPQTSPIYTVIRIPASSPRLAQIVTKFRETKLAALKAEPDGFAVKYADEALHPIAAWQQRLAAPSTILICVATSDPTPASSDEDALISGEWVGMSTIRGPLPYSVFHLPESGQPVPDDPALETRWHLCNVYTSEAHRRQGLARRLVHASVDAAREQTVALEGKDRMKARIRLFMDPAKMYLVTMYTGMGFKEAGMCTLKEAFVANGDGELIPEDTDSTEEKRRLWERRYGLAMERIVDA
jgi:ribosomal protein S18 acetylase RimI-like enzyme